MDLTILNQGHPNSLAFQIKQHAINSPRVQEEALELFLMGFSLVDSSKFVPHPGSGIFWPPGYDRFLMTIIDKEGI